MPSEGRLSRRRSRLPVETVDLPAGFSQLLAAARTVCEYEGARTHQERWREHGLRIGAKLAGLVGVWTVAASWLFRQRGWR